MLLLLLLLLVLLLLLLMCCYGSCAACVDAVVSVVAVYVTVDAVAVFNSYTKLCMKLPCVPR